LAKNFLSKALGANVIKATYNTAIPRDIKFMIFGVELSSITDENIKFPKVKTRRDP